MANSNREHSVKDDEITSVISSAQREKLYKYRNVRNQSARKEWHSDITFEPIPSDYTLLRLTELPKTGGDTLWASGYEVYDRISEPYQKFLEGLTATCAQPRFNEAARENDFTVHPGPRGAPENSDFSTAIWDNRPVYHAATWDYEGLSPRTGHRAAGLGERPYLDPKSIGRREALTRDEKLVDLFTFKCDFLAMMVLPVLHNHALSY
ncbi:hypothetical protein N7535_005996 [Penicillium sp. DV-2018c]|nr:hypothetical protein N7461_009575 [Penicillium sp. DV-2018c]KAJ5572336.1 hypothetical protein N7535_005996 [Penicillium sp. DV-2018c]